VKPGPFYRLLSALFLGLLSWVALWIALNSAAQATSDPAQRIAAGSGDVVINEVAWGGTAAGTADEWIELYNATDAPITLTNWTLVADDGAPAITLSGMGSFAHTHQQGTDTRRRFYKKRVWM